MDILEAYGTNAAMRQQYFRINKITCAQLFDEQGEHKDGRYIILLGNGKGQGWQVERVFRTKRDAKQWVKTYAPELEWVDGIAYTRPNN